MEDHGEEKRREEKRREEKRREEKSRAEQSRAEQSRAEQSRAEQSRAEQRRGEERRGEERRGEERRGEKRRGEERRGEERRGEEKGEQMMNITCFKNTNAVASRGKCFLHIENSKNHVFHYKKRANCETPFPVFLFCKILTKTTISGLIRLIFGSVTLVDTRGDRLRPVSAEFRGSLPIRCLRGGKLARRGQLRCCVLWWTVFAGPWWLVDLARGETQEERLLYFCLRRSDVDDDEQVDTQFQQELFTLRAQVAAECGLADAVRAINNLATAQVLKDTPSLLDVKGLGRPKEFCGEEDFQ